MNPITKFESTARQIWKSTLDPSEKAVRLRAVAKGIQHYVGRVPAEPSDAIKRDPFAIRSRSRVVRYLEMLAEDIENLATHCQAVAKKTVSTVTVARVAATS